MDIRATIDKYISGYDGDATNAIEMLKKDHERVKDIFEQYRALVEEGVSGNKDQKMALVKEACDALAIHSQIEEEIFYPAVQGEVGNNILAEAFVEHDCAKDLIQQLEAMKDDEALFDAKFIVLGEMVKHHIEEEEDEIFPKASKSNIDLYALGAEMQERKDELLLQASFPERVIQRESAPTYVV